MLSIWETSFFHKRPQLAVIGGGIVGTFTALFYKRAHPQHHVIVLEKGAFPSGASVKNAGFACFGSPSELLADINQEGLDAAMARVELRWQGLQDLRAELGDAALGYEQCGGHEVFTQDDPLYTHVQERFDELNRALESILGARAYTWENDLIGSFGLEQVTHLARTACEGALNSGALMSALLRKAVAEGVLFRSSASVVVLEEGSDQVKITLADGTEVFAAQALIATNGYATQLVPELDVLPGRGQVLLTSPISGLKLKGTFHYGEGYYYFRDFGGGVLFGGGRELDLPGETTFDEGTSPVIQDTLERLLNEMILPGMSYSIDQRWSGIMGFGSRSKTPIVERISPRKVVAVRLGGMGVAIGIRVAREAAALLDQDL